MLKRRIPEKKPEKKKTSTNEKILLVLGVCCVGIVLILALGMMMPEVPQAEPAQIDSSAASEMEYIDLMMSSANAMNTLLGDTATDIDALLNGKINESQFIAREEARKREYEGILSELEATTPPPAFETSHDYYVKSIEYAILSSEYSIEGFRTYNPALIEESTRYMNLCGEYAGKATDALPV